MSCFGEFDSSMHIFGCNTLVVTPNVNVMKTPACRTSRESMGVQKSPNNFDLNLVTLTYDLDLCDLDLDPRNLDLGPPFLKLG